MAKDPIRMPREVDDPPVLMVWSADELAFFMAFFLVGFLLEQLLIASLIGVVMVRLMRRYRNTHQKGALIHQLYWYGAWPNRARSVGNPFERDHIG